MKVLSVSLFVILVAFCTADETVLQCDPTTEIINDCGNVCEVECKDAQKIAADCTGECRSPACVCRPLFFRHDNGNCVIASECPLEWNDERPLEPSEPLETETTSTSALLEPTTRRTKFDPTLIPYGSFSPEEDCAHLYDSVWWFGLDDERVLKILCLRPLSQRLQIIESYKTVYEGNLTEKLESKMWYSSFKSLILDLLVDPTVLDAWHVNGAIVLFEPFISYKTGTISEILITKTNAEIKELKKTYSLIYGEDLVRRLMGKLGVRIPFVDFLIAVLKGSRNESMETDRAKARFRAQELYAAGERELGTEEQKFIDIFTSESFAQLNMINDAYKERYNRSLETAIDKEMSGAIKVGLLAILEYGKYPPSYFAQRLHKAVNKIGTDDNTLIRIVRKRSEIDMVQIKEEYERLYGSTLKDAIIGDTSGSYQQALLAMIGESN